MHKAGPCHANARAGGRGHGLACSGKSPAARRHLKAQNINYRLTSLVLIHPFLSWWLSTAVSAMPRDGFLRFPDGDRGAAGLLPSLGLLLSRPHGRQLPGDNMQHLQPPALPPSRHPHAQGQAAKHVGCKHREEGEPGGRGRGQWEVISQLCQDRWLNLGCWQQKETCPSQQTHRAPSPCLISPLGGGDHDVDPLGGYERCSETLGWYANARCHLPVPGQCPVRPRGVAPNNTGSRHAVGAGLGWFISDELLNQGQSHLELGLLGSQLLCPAQQCHSLKSLDKQCVCDSSSPL